jgi:hypothetical protein
LRQQRTGDVGENEISRYGEFDPLRFRHLGDEPVDRLNEMREFHILPHKFSPRRRFATRPIGRASALR